MRAHLDDFSGKLSAGLSKPARRFVSEVLYGIAARGSVRLSEIGRALEERIALIKTEARLSRNLGRAELRELLGAAVLREGSARIGGRTLLVLDISDIAKPYARKMEYLARVRDGSTGDIADGYWLCQGRWLLAVPGDRGGERGQCHRAALQRALFPEGPRLPVREPGDQDGILTGGGGL
jgi:hypothetical protein